MRILTVDNAHISISGKPDKCLLDKCSFTLDAGQILSIIGPNGAGKSSLLKAIAGDMPFGGQIDINQVCNKPNERARQLAVLPQQSTLNFPFRVHEVVNLSRLPHASGAEIDNQIVNEALTMLDVLYLKQRLYTELSGGEKQRVQLARVLAQIWREQDAPNGTRLLLLDEPTAALDLGHQHDLMRAVQTFAQQGVAVLMVLHDINLASRYSDKILALLCSQTIAYGAPQDVINAQLIKALFQTDVEILSHPGTDRPMISAL